MQPGGGGAGDSNGWVVVEEEETQGDLGDLGRTSGKGLEVAWDQASKRGAGENQGGNGETCGRAWLGEVCPPYIYSYIYRIHSLDRRARVGPA